MNGPHDFLLDLGSRAAALGYVVAGLKAEEHRMMGLVADMERDLEEARSLLSDTRARIAKCIGMAANKSSFSGEIPETTNVP